MAASLTREEYYLSGKRLLARTNRRRSVHHAWPSLGDFRQIVCTIEDRGKQKKLVKGLAGTEALLVAAILRHERRTAKPSSRDIGKDCPQRIRQNIARKAGKLVKQLSQGFYGFADEQSESGALTFGMNQVDAYVDGDWRATIVVQQFSPQTKEGRTGADLGIIMDITEDDEQVSKAIWIQAKQHDNMPSDVWTLPDFKDQIETMLRRTRESYGMVYSADQVRVFHGLNQREIFSLDEVLDDMILCDRGDRDPTVLADTLYRNFLIEIAVSSSRRGAGKANWLLEGF